MKSLSVSFVFFLLFTPTKLTALNEENCKKKIARIPHLQFTMTGQESSLKDLEEVFSALYHGKSFELRIPKGIRLNLFPTEPKQSVRHIERTENYYPYRFKSAETLDAQYRDDIVSALRDCLYDIERAQKLKRPLPEIWKANFDGKFFFTRSPTTGKSNRLFQRPERLRDIVKRTQRLGTFPFLELQKNGDRVITNRHFLDYLKDGGNQSLKLYRGHGAFDTFFYRLLLGKENMQLRKKFALWLEEETLNFARSRNVSEEFTEKIIQKLRNNKIPTEEIIEDLSKNATTSAMFTSLSNTNSTYWTRGKGSELLNLNLNLDKITAGYLEQVLFGADLDIEVVFPFLTSSQRTSLREALKIEN